MENKKKAGLLGWWIGIPLVWRILGALVLGGIVGISVGPKISLIAPLGDLMIKLLQMIILPLIFFAIVMGIGSMPASKVGKIGAKIIGYYFSTTFVAAIFAVILANVFKPGLRLSLENTSGLGETAAITAPKISEILLNMVPENVFQSLAEGSYLQVLVFALFFGLAISVLRDSESESVRESVLVVYKACEGGAEIMFTITNGILEYTPIGVFTLISIVFAEEGAKFITSIAIVIGLCYLGYLFQIIFVYGTALKLNNLNPLRFFARAKDATLMAFATRSSGATLPLSLSVAEEKLGVDRSVSGFTLPLGSQINLDGEAYYQIIAVFTAAFAAGIHLSLPEQMVVVLVVTVGTMGTAGIAGAGPVILLAVMGMVGLEVETGSTIGAVFALILGIDVILDMGRTAVNVTGDLVGTAIVAKSEGLLDLSIWEEEK